MRHLPSAAEVRPCWRSRLCSPLHQAHAAGEPRLRLRAGTRQHAWHAPAHGRAQVLRLVDARQPAPLRALGRAFSAWHALVRAHIAPSPLRARTRRELPSDQWLCAARFDEFVRWIHPRTRARPRGVAEDTALHALLVRAVARWKHGGVAHAFARWKRTARWSTRYNTLAAKAVCRSVRLLNTLP